MKHLKIHQEQDGIIAFFSVLVIMGILTLLTIGFSKVTRDAKKRTFDDALNTQAFYAAETGVNGAITAVRSGGITSANTTFNDATVTS